MIEPVYMKYYDKNGCSACVKVSPAYYDEKKGIMLFDAKDCPKGYKKGIYFDDPLPFAEVVYLFNEGYTSPESAFYIDTPIGKAFKSISLDVWPVDDLAYFKGYFPK